MSGSGSGVGGVGGVSGVEGVGGVGAGVATAGLELGGRVALVTGAGRGIGRATAVALAHAGACVMAVARSGEELRSLDEHPRIAIHPVSLSTPEGCADAIAQTTQRLGPIDILVSNAGMGSADEAPIFEQDPGVWHASMAINLHAPFELIRLASAEMATRCTGRIVVVSSTAGLAAESAGETAYTAAKHAVIGLARAAALDLAPYGVTVNAVCPGWVRTEMAERSAIAQADRQGVTVEQIWTQRASGYAAGRVVDVDEVAGLIRFLVGPGASGISGEAIRVALGQMF
jgi:NAD(P)-dependent dehydrogenase (short-subunit alcohol dehydrogenase family)